MKNRSFAAASDNWETPPEFYKYLNDRYDFNFDPCPLKSEFNGLKIKWYGNIFINPPYSNTRKFLEKGLKEKKLKNADTLVYLLPSRTDTKWFHELILNKAEIRFIKGRLKFSGHKNSAPFPSIVVIYK